MRRRWAAAGFVCLAACTPAVRDGARPEAEFLLVSDDSTAWVRTSADTVVVQRAPMLVATLGGRLVEIYVADDALNFDEASFVVSRVFRRDLVTGDSTLLYADSAVLRDAMEWVRLHPDAERLDDEEPVPDGVRTFESAITPLEVVHTTLGLEVHRDRTVGALGTHDTFRATVDLQTGRRLSLADVIPARSAGMAVAEARRHLVESSVLASRRGGAVGRAAGRAIAALVVDSLSFSLSREGDSLAAAFLAHDEQVIDEAHDTHRYALEPIAVPAPGWWAAGRRGLPHQLADSVVRLDVGTLALDVRYDEQDMAEVSLRTTGGRRPITRMRGPVRRAIAVGDSLVAPADRWRAALERAFSESGYYSDQVRAASLRRRARPTAARQAAL